MSDIFVSAVIVNFNGCSRTIRCVESVLNCEHKSLECVVVDNGSTDGSMARIAERFGGDARVKGVALARNYGPAYARNRGIEAAGGRYVAFLDNDTVVSSGWLREPVRRMTEDESIGACQCKLVLLGDSKRVDYVGDYLGRFGFLVQRAESWSVDQGQWEEEVEIFSAKSAGMVARRQAVCDAGMFDEDYFIYVEETDLDWRIWLAGYRIIYCPRSVVLHEYSTSRVIVGAREHDRLVKFHGCKNYVLTLLKNLGLFRLLWLLPMHVGVWVGLATFELVRGRWRNACWIVRGLMWNVRHIVRNIRKRRDIQSRRCVRDRDLWPRIYRHVPLSYYVKKLRVVPTGPGHSEGF